MAIDQTGYDNFARGVDDFARCIIPVDSGSVINSHDPPAFDCHAAIFNHPARAIHRHHGSAAYN